MALKEGFKSVTYHVLDDDKKYVKESRWTHSDSVEVDGKTLTEKMNDVEIYLIKDTERNILEKLSLDDSGNLIYKNKEVGYTIPNEIEGIYVNNTKLLPDVNKNVKIGVPTKLSELKNDTYFIKDINYTHTDNNYTDEDKAKLATIENNAQANKIESIVLNGVEQPINNKQITITLDNVGGTTVVEGDKNVIETIIVNGVTKQVLDKAININYEDVITDDKFEQTDISWTTSYKENDDELDAGGNTTLVDSDFENTDITFADTDFSNLL